MSLFSMRDYWSISIKEEFDTRHLVSADLTGNAQMYIILASYAGKLRVYSPKYTFEAQVEHKIAQHTFHDPILQITVNNSRRTSERRINILFLKKFMTFQLKGNQLKQTGIAELNSPAYQMVTYQGYTIIQHLTPNISFMSQTFLTSYISITPLVYPQPIPLLNSKFYIQISPEYNLAIYSLASMESKNNSFVTQENTIEFGQEVVKMEEYMNQRWVAGRFSVMSAGIFKKKKKFQQEITAFKLTSTQKQSRLLIATISPNLLIYNNQFVLLWASTLSSPLIALDLGSFQSNINLIIQLDNNGNLLVQMLGMILPKRSIIEQKTRRQHSWQQLQGQRRMLQSILNAGGTNNKDNKKQKGLKMRINLDGPHPAKQYIQNPQPYAKINTNKVKAISLTIFIQNLTKQQYTNTRLYISTPDNIQAQDKIVEVGILKPQGSFSKVVELYVLADMFPYQEGVDVFCGWQVQRNGLQSRSLQMQIGLPLQFQMQLGIPNKQSSAYKLHLISQIPINPQQIFSINCQTSNTYTFYLANNVQVSILIAKNSNKYRLQSNYYQGLLFMVQAVRLRCKNLLFQTGIPLQQMFQRGQNYYEGIENLKQLQKKIIIQKRILSRFKDKIPTGVESFNYLLEQCQQKQLQLADEYLQIKQNLQVDKHKFTIAARLILNLLLIKAKPDQKTEQTLKALFLLNDEDTFQFSWFNKILSIGKYLIKGQTVQGNYQKVKKIIIWVIDKTLKKQLNY